MSWSFPFGAPPAGDAAQLQAILGGKGANLVVMANELGLPVPPGFVITTDACKAYIDTGWPSGLDEELRIRIAELETVVGRRFGDDSDPLLVSVRSGAPVSMPGMLDTILNLGLTEATTAGLATATGDAAFAAGCRTRLHEMYTASVGVAAIPDDPWEQLREAVEAVFRSWDSERAQSYRDREGIPADLGTAVVVQAMVFGNRGGASATGVLFTRDPATGEDRIYGDVLFDAQGEDVVAGTHATEPVDVLDERAPRVAAELRSHADTLERHYRDLCDIEFTIEEGTLWMLQNRVGKRSAQAALRIALEMGEAADFPLTRREAVERVASILADPPLISGERETDAPALARGLPASPGLAAGVIATSPAAAVTMADAGARVILVRRETSPDDVHGMARAAGILTSTGGLASHAAVVARGWDLPAVVGATDVVVEDGRITIGTRTWAEGDEITIDGSTGEVFDGAVASAPTIAPEVEKLLAWAREFDIPIEAADASSREAADTGGDVVGSASSEASEPSVDDGLRALLIRGYVSAELLAHALRTTPEGAARLLETLEQEGLANISSDIASLNVDGQARAKNLLEADRAAWGDVDANSALDAFVDLDRRVKQIVTEWQMRDVDGEQVLNDHADAAYDAGVMAALAAFHAEVSVWIGPLVAGLPRLAAYDARLHAAATAVIDDGRYVASPRVDSYHGIWFELHEDLIRLAGRTREDEVAAGRA